MKLLATTAAPGRRHTRLRVALAGLAALITGTIATAAPASAATSSAAAPLTKYCDNGDSTYSDAYVAGYGLFSWNCGTPVNQLLQGDLEVLCVPGQSWAQVAIAVEDTSGGWHGGPWHTTHVCNGMYQSAPNPPLAWGPTNYSIKAWTIKVQRSGGGVATGNIVPV
jgi:hypothetical protein